MDFTLMTAVAEMAGPISRLVHTSFSELAAGDWEPSASERLLSETSPEAIAALLEAPAFAAVEVRGEQPVGFILMPRPSLVSMLFVHPQYLRQGVAKRLWEAARGHIGSPSYVGGGEVFWGDGRLDDALAWCVDGGA